MHDKSDTEHGDADNVHRAKPNIVLYLWVGVEDRGEDNEVGRAGRSAAHVSTRVQQAGSEGRGVATLKTTTKGGPAGYREEPGGSRRTVLTKMLLRLTPYTHAI